MRRIFMVVMAFALTGVVALAAEKTIPNRIEDIKQGEWVMMEDVSPDGAGEKVKVSVTAITGGKITLRREHYDRNGMITETKESEVPVERMRERFADIEKRAKTITEEFVMVGDKSMPVIAIHWEGEGKDDDGKTHEYKIWLSEKLPLTGVAKFWSSDNGVPHAEILDYGFGNN